MKIPNIHHVAIIKAVVERKYVGSFFGSTGALSHWIEEAIAFGFIERTQESDNLHASSLGQAIYRALRLDELPDGRQTGWQSLAIQSLLHAGDAIEIRGDHSLTAFAGCRAQLDEDPAAPWFRIRVVNPETGRRKWVDVGLRDIDLVDGMLLRDAAAIAQGIEETDMCDIPTP